MLRFTWFTSIIHRFMLAKYSELWHVAIRFHMFPRFDQDGTSAMNKFCLVTGIDRGAKQSVNQWLLFWFGLVAWNPVHDRRGHHQEADVIGGCQTAKPSHKFAMKDWRNSVGKYGTETTWCWHWCVYANIFWDILKQFGGDFFWKLPQQQLLVACMNHSTPCFEATEALQWPLFNFEKITLNSRIAMYSAHQHVNIINLCIDICMVLMSIYIYICICSYTVYIYIYMGRERDHPNTAKPQVFPDHANHAAMPSLELRISPGMEGRVFQYGNGSKPMNL